MSRWWKPVSEQRPPLAPSLASGTEVLGDAVSDFEDILELFDKHDVRYLIIGGLAVIYHAKPRYTKDIDFWIAPESDNVQRANQALAEFGSPYLLDPQDAAEILQLGVPPNRIDLLRQPTDSPATTVTFEEAWPRRVEGRYGRARALWIDLDSLISIKSSIAQPRHQEDARVLKQVRALRRTPEQSD
jgi:hypothetical protein